MLKFNKWAEPMSALTHLIALLLCIPCVVMLIVLSAKAHNPWAVVSFSVFGASLILLYLASTIYHMLPVKPKARLILRRIDHMMIFVLIAGSYTPICLLPLRGAWGWSLFGTIWGIAVCGIVLKALWIEAPRWLSTLIYVVMGWLIVIAFFPLQRAVSSEVTALLIAGGVIYTIGAVIYGLKPEFLNFKNFGFHEIFHLFVMGGSCCHILLMFSFI